MPNQNTITYFKKGLHALRSTGDIKKSEGIIKHLVYNTDPQDAYAAKEAIANVLMEMRDEEAKNASYYENGITRLDEKYNYLGNVLDKASPRFGEADSSGEIDPLISPSQVINSDSFKSFLKPKTLFKYASIIGGSWLLFSSFSKKEEKKTSLERTLESLHKYKVFSSVLNDPNFDGDYKSLLNGKYKPKPKEKKKSLATEKKEKWRAEELKMLDNMDKAAKAITTSKKEIKDTKISKKRKKSTEVKSEGKPEVKTHSETKTATTPSSSPTPKVKSVSPAKAKKTSKIPIE